MEWGMPDQGANTPRITMSERRIIRPVGVKKEMGLCEVDEERGEIGWFIRWSGSDGTVVLYSSDDGPFLPVQGSPQGEIMSWTWPLAERWWPEIRYTTDSAGHGGRKIVGGNMRKEMTPWAGNLEGKLNLRLWPHTALLVWCSVLLTVFGYCGLDRDRGYIVGLPDTDKCGSDRGSGCSINRWAGKAGKLRTFKPGLSHTLIGSWFGYNTSPEPDPFEATLVHIISQVGTDLRCGLSVYLTGLGNYMTDWDRGCNFKLSGSGNCESNRDRGCIVVSLIEVGSHHIIQRWGRYGAFNVKISLSLGSETLDKRETAYLRVYYSSWNIDSKGTPLLHQRSICLVAFCFVFLTLIANPTKELAKQTSMPPM
ncbi:hypothetical protein V6N11_083717 [Hibiscus sabdariffa]|uniref:Uncharacterized protein n=1 Tax=Hibiscus sabdariffa TaxID=183260 RepID=A0ABR2QCV0_9ROSI